MSPVWVTRILLAIAIAGATTASIAWWRARDEGLRREGALRSQLAQLDSVRRLLIVRLDRASWMIDSLLANPDTVELVRYREARRRSTQVLASRPEVPAEVRVVVDSALDAADDAIAECRVSYENLRSACEVFRTEAAERFRIDSLRLEAATKLGQQRSGNRRWSLGVTGGYGLVLGKDGRITHGPTVSVGVSFRLF